MLIWSFFSAADDTYLNLTLQGDVHEIIQPAGTQSIQWIVLVAAHPEPVLTWSVSLFLFKILNIIIFKLAAYPAQRFP